MDRNYRVHTNIINDTLLNVDMRQDFDFLEVLSLKLRQVDAYKLHSSNYGVIVGRVLANDAFGIPNAKISLFIEADGADTTTIESIYPYTEITTKDRQGRRYNTLPDYSDDECYRVVGTFPNKRFVLDDDTQLEIYDKYWKYSTVTNGAGDYMLFGVPSGSQQIHVDIDLSDIGILSQKPTDFIYKGYNNSMFDNPKQFKESTNLDGLAQIFSQNKSVFVYPFWGDSDNGIAAITRSDVQIQYKFEPTCIFMGSIVSDNEGNAIGHKCAPDIKNGMNNQLIAGEGTIEMIRKTQDGLVEEYQVQNGESLIDENGTWCYQIPMNLDFVGTDEYGNIVPTDDPKKGIPTRTQVRFRISKNETGDEGFSRHTAKYLVPMNPILDEDKEVPSINIPGADIEKMYNFGSNTPQSCFRDLYWNNVYSVKNYVPKFQVAHRAYSKNYGALKGSNLVDDQNPIPFNQLRFDLPFVYIALCIIYSIVIIIVSILNWAICVIDLILGLFAAIKNIKIFGFKPFSKLLGWLPDPIGCISLSAGMSVDDTAYYPGCWCTSTGLKYADCPEGMDDGCNKKDDNSELKDRIQQSLAQEYSIVKLDFYQDWLNGCLYMPLWYWRKRKKKKFLGFTIRRAKNQFCSCDTIYGRMKTYVTCMIPYRDNSFGVTSNEVPDGEEKWHKLRRKRVYFRRGVIKQVENADGLNVYYYSAVDAVDNDNNKNPRLPLAKRDPNFEAIRLFATDIILLGNINENNLYGIPQMFTALPSTTANIPPIATISELATNQEETEEVHKYDNDAANAEDSGVTITTGMDWGNKRDAKRDKPKFSKGLFMDLACTYIDTRAKSCINAERLSEFGVNLDGNFMISYSTNRELSTGEVDGDGFISKYELDDMENRAMFATMNHIGFIPQSYQDSINGYTTQVRDDKTNYFIPKFKYIYPVDFDGRMQPSMDSYKNGFQQSMYDEVDQSYITFRLGAESSTRKNNNSEGRIRHFYFTNKTDDKYYMPLYNNSFYFYFGISKGNTAIDRFNRDFYSKCFTNKKEYFSLDLKTRGATYCADAYKNYKDAYGYIEVISDDIQIPYSYKLTDTTNNVVVVEESNMSQEKFVIGGKYGRDGYPESCTDGNVHYQLVDGIPSEDPCSTDVTESSIKQLENKAYNLEMVDGNGKKITKRVTLEMPKLDIGYKVVPLGVKFYNEQTTKMEYVCNKDNDFCGKVYITGVTVDGYECTISDVFYTISDNAYVFTIKFAGIDGPINSGDAKIWMEAIDVPSTPDCMCRGGDNVWTDVTIEGTSVKTIIMNVYQPTKFSAIMKQLCNGVTIEDNRFNGIITVPNGENFNTSLNEMPLRFMLGSVEEGKEMPIASNSGFYSKDAVRDPKDSRLRGWFGVHKEDTYSFSNNTNIISDENEDMWMDFVDFYQSIKNYYSKLAILKYKFNSMFSLSEAVYVTESSNQNFTFSHVGGTQPVLTRAISPDFQSSAFLDGQYLYEDSESAIINKDYPFIVGKNYDEVDEDGPVFNPKFESKELLGSYFAAFTKNGGYKNNVTIDPTIKIIKQPNYAAVSMPVYNPPSKKIGEDYTGFMSAFDPFKRAHTQVQSGPMSRPHLRAISIDRRFDFDLNVFGPVVGSSFPLYTGQTSSGNSDKDLQWKGMRISGVTFNGIEMSYDENHNIVSADTEYDSEGEPVRAKENKRLEYSYSAKGDSDVESATNAITFFNKATGDTVWPEDGGDDAKKTLIKRPYEASVNGFGIEKLFWSNFNKKRLVKYCNEVTKDDWFYYVPDRSEATDSFNGDFDKDNYPTRRLLDVANIPPLSKLAFSYIPCAYKPNVAIKEDGSLAMELEAGDGEGFEMDFSPAIHMTEPEDENHSYANLQYNMSGSSSGYTQFTSNVMKLDFNLVPKTSNGDFTIYTDKPKVIRVLPYFQANDNKGNPIQVDGIKRIKWTGILKGTTNDVNGLLSSRNGIVAHEFTPPGFFGTGEISVPSGIKYGVTQWFHRGDERLTSDDQDFKNITFKTSFVLNGGLGTPRLGDVFALLIPREYVYDGEGFLTKHINVWEFSELFDARKILLKPNNGTSSCGSGESYVQYVGLGSVDGVVTDPEINVDVDSETGEGSGSVSVGEGEVSGYIQIISFSFNLGNENSIDVCKAIGEYDTVSYSFTFERGGTIYTITPDGDDIHLNNNILTIDVRWTQEMGYLGDDRWGGSAYTAIYITSRSGFTYKVGAFTLRGSQSSVPDKNNTKRPTTGLSIR